MNKNCGSQVLEKEKVVSLSAAGVPIKVRKTEEKYTRSLERVRKEDFPLVGGKGANLGEMIGAGLPVPGGFVLLTTSYQRFVKVNNLEDKIFSLIGLVDVNNLEKLQEASKNIQALFEAGEIPGDIREEVDRVYESLGSPEVAVRSSATAEDLPGTSFAGQYNTYLNVKGHEELYKYIKECWASLWNYRALSYRVKHNISNKGLAHGVIVQEMISADKSGILFTANPVNGRRDQMLLNSSWGLGEAIVGGEVTPDQWIMDRKEGKILEEIIPSKEVMSVRKEKGIELVPVPSEKQEEVTLTKREVARLLEFGERVENYFASPQDIEWSHKDGKFYMVQTRPITSLYPMPEKRNNKRDLRVFININNYSQAMPEPFTPMGEDIIRAVVEGLVTKYGQKGNQENRLWWYQVLGGRIFLDITDFMRTEKSWNKFKGEDPTDKDPITTRALLQLLERNREDIINPKESVKLARMINLRLIKLLLKTGLKYCYGMYSPAKAREKAVSLGENVIKELERESKSLKTTEDKIKFFREKASLLVTEGFGIVFYVAVSSTYLDQARKIMAQYLEDTSDLKYVEKSVPYSVTTEMGMEILELAKHYHQKGEKPRAQDEEMVKFLEKYGHRSSIELEVGVPIWREDPRYVLDLINSYIDNQNYQEALDKFNRGKVEAQEAIERIKAQLEEKGQKKKAKQVEKLLINFRNTFGGREQSKFFIRQLLTIFRGMLLEIGEELEKEGRIEDKGDVFYITRDDIKSRNDLKEKVKKNKEDYALDFNKTAPRLLTSTGESIYSASLEVSENTLVGVPVSPGVYEGKARVLKTPEEGHKLNKGDILVTQGTNPAWTPLFLKLGALVMETGGPISHGSVVAREYGVPAAAGVARATTIIKEGQNIRVNGETGTVEITG